MSTGTSKMEIRKVVGQEEWLAARKELLTKVFREAKSGSSSI